MVRAANPFTPFMVGRKVRINLQRDERIDIDSVGTLQAYSHDRTGNSVHFRFQGDGATSIVFLDKDIFTVQVEER
jgi:hypothetical protein